MEQSLNGEENMSLVGKSEVANNNPSISQELIEETGDQSKVDNTKTEPTLISKEAAVENAKKTLDEKRQFLSDNASAEKNILKSAQTNVNKAEQAYKDALKELELPKLPIEFWEVEESNEEKEVIRKCKAEIIIATSDYSMSASKVSVELGKELIFDEKFEKDTPLFLMKAQLFYDAGIELRDLNGNVIPKDTPDVHVPIDTSDSFWKCHAYYQANIDAKVKGEDESIIINARIKKFKSLQDFAKYRGVNIVLSKGMNGIEKAGNAALATQNDFYIKINEKARELKANISVITRYYNSGKTLNLNVWNDAMRGNVEPYFEYDLSIGDKIIKTLEEIGLPSKIINQRYVIDAITQLTNYKPEFATEKIGLDEVLTTIKSLEKTTINLIQEATNDKLNEIYSALLTNYLKRHNKLRGAA